MYSQLKHLPEDNASCTLCGKPCFRALNISHVTFVCRICGCYRISEEVDLVIAHSEKYPPNQRYRLSYAFRTASEMISAPVDVPIYGTEDLSMLLQSTPDPGVVNKLALLLNYLARRSSYPGDLVDFDFQHDYTFICARKHQEAIYFYTALQEQGLIKSRSNASCEVTTAGWRELERQKSLGFDSPNGFIAMWFSPERSSADTAMVSAITNAGYRPVRIDRVQHINRIDDEYWLRLGGLSF